MTKFFGELELLGGTVGCAGGTCPAVYRDKSGKLFVQGTRISSELRELVPVAEHEDIVELTPELLAVLRDYQQ